MRFLFPGETLWHDMLWQDLEGQIAAQRDGMEELAGRTHQLVEENDQVSFRMRASRLCCGNALTMNAIQRTSLERCVSRYLA